MKQICLVDDALESWHWFPRHDKSCRQRPLCTCQHEPQHPGIHGPEYCNGTNTPLRWFVKREETETALVKSIVSAVQVLDVRSDVLVLIRRPREVIRESSSSEGDGSLGLDTSRSPDSSNEGA